MHWADIFENFDFLMKGLIITLKLALISVSGSLIIGIILGILRHTRFFLISWFAVAYIESVRSIPLILFIVFIHFGALPYLTGEPSSFFVSSCIAFIIFNSAYIAEIIRSGLNSVEKGHIDAAKSLGLNRFQRLAYIILPLAVTRMTPALVSQFISLIKDTSLASTIGLIELTRSGEIIYERTYHETEILIFIAFVYFVICFGLSKLSRVWETKPYMYIETKEPVGANQ
jgi:His/Glu/Gln/Arg/opine family amino acid ABC transporter permease subunit